MGFGEIILRITRLFALVGADCAAGARWIASCRGRSQSRRRIALARKLAVLMHRLWITGEAYEAIPETAAKAA